MSRSIGRRGGPGNPWLGEVHCSRLKCARYAVIPGSFEALDQEFLDAQSDTGTDWRLPLEEREERRQYHARQHHALYKLELPVGWMELSRPEPMLSRPAETRSIRQQFCSFRCLRLEAAAMEKSDD
jgi:hypothetical protein